MGKISSLNYFRIDLINGGEGHKVGEHFSSVLFDLEAYLEPKILNSHEMKRLMGVLDKTIAVAKFFGCSQSFVSERLKAKKKSKTKPKGRL